MRNILTAVAMLASLSCGLSAETPAQENASRKAAAKAVQVINSASKSAQASPEISAPTTRNATTFRVLAACHIKRPNHPPYTMEGFVGYMRKELGKDAVQIVAEVTLPVGVSVVVDKIGYKSVKKFAILEISEQAVADKMEKTLQDAKQNPEKYKYVLPLAKDIWTYLENLSMDTAGDCDMLVPTRFEIRRLQE